jgi:microcystin-dependent protein
VSIAAAVTGLQAAGADAITVTAAGADAITVAANTGGGAAHPNVPPWQALNFIVRYQ